MPFVLNLLADTYFVCCRRIDHKGVFVCYTRVDNTDTMRMYVDHKGDPGGEAASDSGRGSYRSTLCATDQSGREVRHICLPHPQGIQWNLRIHFGDERFVHCSEVVPSSEVEMYRQ